MLTPSLLNVSRIAVISATMLYASYRDWVDREVDDWVWILGGGVGAALTILDFILYWSMAKLIFSLISIALASGLAFAFYFFGLYGGADAKAVAVISVSLPIYYVERGFHPFTGLASLSNGLLVSLILPLSMLVYNLIQILKGRDLFRDFEHEGAWRKVLALFLGTRVANARGKEFWFSMEEEREGKRYFSFNVLSIELEGIRDDMWATPGIPLLIFITAGFIIYIAYGDIIYLILSLFGLR